MSSGTTTLNYSSKFKAYKFVVLFKTPSNTNREMFQKADEHIKDGYQMVCVVFPEKRIVSVHYPDGNYDYLVDGDILDGGDVLPGFTLPVATLFP